MTGLALMSLGASWPSEHWCASLAGPTEWPCHCSPVTIPTTDDVREVVLLRPPLRSVFRPLATGGANFPDVNAVRVKERHACLLQTEALLLGQLWLHERILP